MSKIVTFSPNAKEELIKGVNILADVVGVTLGPKGRNVVIDTYGAPAVTKDGVTVASQVALEDPIQNLGAQIVKQAASKTAKIAGDGTTTATVLAQALINEGKKLIDSGVSPITVKREYEHLLERTTLEVLKCSKPVTLENVKQIATISANNDEVIGSLIYEGFTFVGTDGTIAVEDSKLNDTYVSTIEGASLNTGYLSPYFVTDPVKSEVVYENPLILITDKKIRHTQEIVPALEIAAKLSKPLIIISDELEANALALLVLNRVRAGLPVAALRAPGFGDRRAELLKDLATLTNATLISDIQSLRLEDLKLDQLGSCEKIIVSKDKTLIMKPKSDAAKLNLRIEEIKTLLSDPSNTSYVTEKLNERLANLTGRIAVLYVGAATETEVKEKKDRIDDALRATKSAIALGYVKGGGLTLFLAAQKLNIRYDENETSIDPTKEAFFKALNAPYKLIQKNANINNVPPLSDDEAINCLTGEVVNFEEAGIIDPTLVIIEALTNAVSAANMVLLSEATIHSIQPKYDPRAGQAEFDNPYE